MASRGRRRGRSILGLACLALCLAPTAWAADPSADAAEQFRVSSTPRRLAQRRPGKNRVLLAGSSCTGCTGGFCEPASGCSFCDDSSGYQPDGTGGCTKGPPPAALTNPASGRLAAVNASSRAGVARLFALHPLCTTHGVLSRSHSGRVFGFGISGDYVKVRLTRQSGQTLATATAQVDSQGHWHAQLGKLPVGKGYVLTATSAGKTLKATDIAVGELWLLSGQSNMFVSLGDTAKSGPSPWKQYAQQELNAAGKDTELRLFKVPNLYSETAKDSIGSKWFIPSADVVDSFTAVGYLTGKKLRETLHVPVGIVQSSYGGSSIIQWLPVDVADKQNVPATTRDGAKRSCFNSMIYPLRLAQFSGVVWYQGESDGGLTFVNPLFCYYEKLLKAMLQAWRSTFGDSNLAFEIVQLPNYSSLYAESVKTRVNVVHWPFIREAQRQVARADSHADLVNILDLGLDTSVHPPNKWDVATRAVSRQGALLPAVVALKSEWRSPAPELPHQVRAIRKNRYGAEVGGTGPTFSYVVGYSTRRATVAFSNFASGLRLGKKSTGSIGSVIRQSGTGTVTCFQLKYGSQWWSATGKLSGHTVKVTAVSSRVKKPTAVRYAWTDAPHCNLYSTIDLPAVPFTTEGDYDEKARAAQWAKKG